VLACFPDVVDEAIAAVQGETIMPSSQLASLRGELGADWDGLLNNPQRDHFVARITALHADQETA
jgi:beta-N-acetylhexosaminidase